MIIVKPIDSNFALCQNAETLKTPGRFSFMVPSKSLAEAIADEFKEQGAIKDLRKMPLTQMAFTAIDITAQGQALVIKEIMGYGQHELICQRASRPAALVAAQTEAWQPYLDWCHNSFKARLKTGAGVVPFEQDEEALGRLENHMVKLDAFSLTGLAEACRNLGSLVLGLALMEGAFAPPSIVAAAEFETSWESKVWGQDVSLQTSYAETEDSIACCAKWFSLLRK